ncbi:Nif3-like dinuclear metal center hexameric protein [bacterium]|nr:Nif3-like dinuclear metal center hexameric protein [bacterium]
MNAKELARSLDTLLDISGIQDASLNGLQVENRKDIATVGLAVDVSYAVIGRAREAGVDFLIVHHGLFWGKCEPVTGNMYNRLRALLDADMALYAVHLPLDVHPELGNNARIQSLLQLTQMDDFGSFQGFPLGKMAIFDPPRSLKDIAADVRSGLGSEPVIWNFGPDQVGKLAYISGGGIGYLEQAVEAGADALLTGEPRHGSYWSAKEYGINVILAGHYATETAGVRAVGEHIESALGLKTVFIDMPTGY